MFIWPWTPSHSQQPQVNSAEPVDTIILISGRKLPARVQRVSSNRISYIGIGKDVVEEMDRKQVHQIKYLSGRVETFNSLAAQLVEEGDWRTVILTEKRDEVEGMYELGAISAKSSPQSRSARAAQRSADIRLRKRASNMGGFMVYITKRETKGGYGEIPSHFVEGIVYGFEPPTK